MAEGVGGPPADDEPVFEPASLDHPHLAAWREAFRSFGAKRYMCSAEALIARGAFLPRINPLVDRYNAVSMRWAVPVDFDRVAPPVQLRFASGDEPFDRPDEHPRRGEVVWVDGAGVTCRRRSWWRARRPLRPGRGGGSARGGGLPRALSSLSA